MIDEKNRDKAALVLQINELEQMQKNKILSKNFDQKTQTERRTQLLKLKGEKQAMEDKI